MSYFLAFDCSLPQAEAVLLKYSKKSLKVLAKSSWTHWAFKFTHSDRLVHEIEKLFKKSEVLLKELNFIAVGSGPGRFTGVRTAVTSAKALAFSLKIPVYPVSSLKALAEEFYGKTKSLYVSLHAFKNQVYFGEFFSQEDQIFVLSFEQWRKKMEKLSQSQKKRICISDIQDYCPSDPQLTKSFLFKKPKLSAVNLVKIVLREKIQAQTGLSLKADYLRSEL